MRTRLREIRKDRGLTLDQLADMIGTSKGFLSDIEREKREPGPKTLQALAEALGISIADVVGSPQASDAELAAFMAVVERLDLKNRQTIEQMAAVLLAGQETGQEP